MNDMHDFLNAKTKAADELRKMHQQAAKSPDYDEQNPTANPHKYDKSLPNNLQPNLSDDTLIIAGLILILSKDCRDIWLFLALLYILM